MSTSDTAIPVDKCDCGRTLTVEEKTYFGTHCTSCETAMSDALNEDKDPRILTELFKKVNGESLPAVGFNSSDFGREFVFRFIDGSTRTAILISSNVHCAYDEDGKPRNLLINLDFK